MIEGCHITAVWPRLWD